MCRIVDDITNQGVHENVSPRLRRDVNICCSVITSRGFIWLGDTTAKSLVNNGASEKLDLRLREEKVCRSWNEAVAQCHRPYFTETLSHPYDSEGTISRSQWEGKALWSRAQAPTLFTWSHLRVHRDQWWTVLVTDRREAKQIKKRKKNPEQSTETEI